MSVKGSVKIGVKECLETYIQPEPMKEFLSKKGHLTQDDLVSILQRLHTVSRNLYKNGMRKEVLLEDLVQIMDVSEFSLADKLDVIETAGIWGKNWDRVMPDQLMLDYLKRRDYKPAYVLYDRLSTPEQKLSLLKAITTFFKIQPIDSYQVIINTAIRMSTNKRQAGEEFFSFFSGDMKILLFTAAHLYYMDDTKDIKISELLGRGADGIAVKAESKKGDTVIKINILPSGSSDKPNLEQRLALLEKISGMSGIVKNDGLYQFNYLPGFDLIIEINEFIKGSDTLSAFERNFNLPDYDKLCRLIQDYARLNLNLFRRGYVNRDINNLSNVLRTREGQMILVDLGNIYPYDPLKSIEYRDDLAKTMARLLTGQAFSKHKESFIPYLKRLFQASPMSTTPRAVKIFTILEHYQALTFEQLLKALDFAMKTEMKVAAAIKTAIEERRSGPGGIDLTGKHMDLQVDSDKSALSSSMNFKLLENIEINGLYIKDIKIKPMNNLQEVLGISSH